MRVIADHQNQIDLSWICPPVHASAPDTSSMASLVRSDTLGIGMV